MSGIDAPSSGIMGGNDVLGYMANGAAGVVRDFWWLADDYNGFPTSVDPVELFVSSASANDTAAGTGLQRVAVDVLRTAASKAYETVEVEMNGLTQVSLGECYRARGATGVRFGSGGTNAGDVTVEDGLANEYSVIGASFGKAAEAVYTVPAGLPIDIRRVYISTVRSNGTNTAAIVALAIREFGSGGFEFVSTFNVPNQVPFIEEYEIPLRVPPLADVKLRLLDSSQIHYTTGEIDFGP